MKQRLNNPVIYIVGPTASGKTGLSVSLAEIYGGEIICGDSMQIYKNMPVATAAPTQEEMKNVNHRMFEFLDPEVKFSVSEYVKTAKAEIEKVKSLGKLPFVVGGTGLYITSLAENINFGEENDDPKIRNKLEESFELLGKENLYNKLKEVDPVSTEKISVNDKKRIIRALEVYYTSGETLSNRVLHSKEGGKIYDNIFIGVTYKDRQKLYERINQRVDIMVQNGLVAEAEKALRISGKTSAQAIGHKELKGYFDGDLSLDEALEHLKMQTRRYAKRQLTWFNRNNDINWIYMDETDNPVSEAEKIINSKLY